MSAQSSHPSIGRSDIARVVVFGARGRMGRALLHELERHDRAALAASVGRGDPMPSTGDLVIDFSSDEGTKSALAASERLSAPLLVGTTALAPDTIEALRATAARLPILVASNASIGVAVVHRMVALAVRALGPTWRAELGETHHVRKKDSPSGTALAIAETIRSAGGRLDPADIRSVREGDVVGRHRIELHGPGETIVLEHAASDRALFARGALELGLWLRSQPAGMHTVQAWLDDRLRERSPA